MNIIFPQVYAEAKVFLAEVSEKRSALLAGRKINIMNAYPNTEADMPAVIIEEKANAEIDVHKELDSYETLSEIMYEVDIFDNSETKVTVCYELAKDINDFFMGLDKTVMRFKRTFSSPTPNISDATVHRHTMRFENLK